MNQNHLTSEFGAVLEALGGSLGAILAPSAQKKTRKVSSRTPPRAPRSPKGQPKSLQILKNARQDPSSESLETRSGKSCLPERLRDLPLCLPYSKYHCFSTSHKVLPGMLLVSFWLHLGSLLGTLGAQKSRKSPRERNLGGWKTDAKKT